MRQELLKLLTWEDVKEIVGVALSTPFDEPTPEDECYKEFLRILLKNNECPPSIGLRFPVVMSAAEQATGRKLSGERSKENTTFRAFVAYKLREEGYTYSDIGKMLQRDHSTVMHLCNIMRDMLSVPMAYQDEMKMYREFERLLGQPLQ